MKVYVVAFAWEDDFEVEAAFASKELAKQYVREQASLRGLNEGEIWIEELTVFTRPEEFTEGRSLEELAKEQFDEASDVERFIKRMNKWVEGL